MFDNVLNCIMKVCVLLLLIFLIIAEFCAYKVTTSDHTIQQQSERIIVETSDREKDELYYAELEYYRIQSEYYQYQLDEYRAYREGMRN